MTQEQLSAPSLDVNAFRPDVAIPPWRLLNRIGSVMRTALPARLWPTGTLLEGRGSCQAQRQVHTGRDRYPEVFAAAAHVARAMRVREPDRTLRVLSFGCSTGEECFSLRSYFPDDEVLGCDINDSVLAVANRRQTDGGIRFFRSSTERLRQNGPFDIVFCMSSLCLFPEANRPSGEKGRFPFSAFDDLLSSIDGNLRPGGLLVIYNASYSFRFATVAPHYDTITTDITMENGFVNKLHRDGRAFTVAQSVNHSRCHGIVSDRQDYQDRDFVDCLFRKRDGEPFSLSFALSAPVPPGIPLCAYSLSDEDLFAYRAGLLTTKTDVELLRAPDGALFETVHHRRRSITDGNLVTVGTFARSIAPSPHPS